MMRRLRGVLAAMAVASLAVARATAQTSLTGAEPPFPPPGRMVDIGGWRLHLNCTGVATPTQPTVILEAGIGDFSVEWSLVQPSVAAFSRVCSYDRADNGWSDWGPRPRTMRQIVYELHTLLEKSGEKPPYVMVGHSFGGWLVRHYRLTYPKDVSAMVLVEGGAENPYRMLSDGILRRSSDLVTGNPIPDVKTSGPVREADLPEGVRKALLGATLMYGGARANEPPRDKLPADAQRMRSWALSQLKHWGQNDNPSEADELALLRAERSQSEFPLGDMPLIVITRGISDSDGPDGKALEADHRADHTAVSTLSRRGRLVVAEKSGHHVQIDEPLVVVSAIRDVLAAKKP